jgi:hypothetical protein
VTLDHTSIVVETRCAALADELWAALLAAKNALPPAPQPAPIPEAYVKATAALDALVAAMGADQQAA